MRDVSDNGSLRTALGQFINNPAASDPSHVVHWPRGRTQAGGGVGGWIGARVLAIVQRSTQLPEKFYTKQGL